MLIASKSGDIAAAMLIRETDKGWLLEVEKLEVRLSKSDDRRRAFEKMSDALTWAGAEQELIRHFTELEAAEADAAKKLQS
ncbi:hypothetical protein B6S59_20905 [Pseudomonas sp. A46]|nr:hypothetical protein [Pseudomonas sp. A46]OWJ92314.1 hypothetical protein B6S59_20905 [Pseudomonas sp. A46]